MPDDESHEGYEPTSEFGRQLVEPIDNATSDGIDYAQTVLPAGGDVFDIVLADLAALHRICDALRDALAMLADRVAGN